MGLLHNTVPQGVVAGFDSENVWKIFFSKSLLISGLANWIDCFIFADAITHLWFFRKLKNLFLKIVEKPKIRLDFVATIGDKIESYFIRIFGNWPFSWLLEILKVKTGPSTPCVALPFFLENVCFLGCAQFSERGPPASKQ